MNRPIKAVGNGNKPLWHGNAYGAELDCHFSTTARFLLVSKKTGKLAATKNVKPMAIPGSIITTFGQSDLVTARPNQTLGVLPR